MSGMKLGRSFGLALAAMVALPARAMIPGAPSRNHLEQLRQAESENAIPTCFRRRGRRNWHQRRRRESVLSAIGDGRGKVLDYGCGYGDLTYAISRRNPVQGVDVDPVRVAFANREYAPVKFSVCHNSLPFADSSFDIVTSTVVIHFVEDHSHYLREAHRVLRPEGRLVITCQNQPVLWNWIRGLAGRPPVGTKLWVPEGRTIHRILEEHGFRIETESHFYDPPTDGCWSLRGVGLTLAKQVLSLLRVRTTCDYYTVVATAVDAGGKAPIFPKT